MGFLFSQGGVVSKKRNLLMNFLEILEIHEEII